MSSNKVENVLVLQGGGSLGAFGCGVFKALANNNINIHIVAGTSIGGLNASIIAGSKANHPEKEMEQFWLELAEVIYVIHTGLYLIYRNIIYYQDVLDFSSSTEQSLSEVAGDSVGDQKIEQNERSIAAATIIMLWNHTNNYAKYNTVN
jgi:predicted patatin/cPLA2 family phospholipase